MHFELETAPTGRRARVERLLGEMDERLAGPKRASARARLDKSAYAGKVWVTRERPYVDRLASFWLVRRYIDPAARIAFLGSKERIERGGERVFFDMAGGDFTHQDGLITFEAMIAAFGLAGAGLARLAATVRAIDLKEEDDQARAIRDVIDGLVLLAKDDLDLVDRALDVFDALHATYNR